MITTARRPPLLRMAGTRAVAAGLALTATLVFAAARPAAAAGAAPRLTLRAQEVPGQHPRIELLARLAAPGDPSLAPHALEGVTVTFAVHLDQFAAAPLLTLGTATTDTAGEARYAYTPTFTGRQALVATAADTTGAMIATATTSYTATTAAHPFAGTVEATRPDGTIGQVVVGVLLTLVALLWIVLVTVVVRVQHHPRPNPR